MGVIFFALCLVSVLMRTLSQDLRYSLRFLARNPGFTSVAVLALALGIGANTAIFSMVNAYLLRPLPFPQPERLALVSQTHREQNLSGSTAFPDYLDWRAQNQVFEDIAALSSTNFNLTGIDEPERIYGIRASVSLFSVVGMKPVLGRGFLPEEDRPGGERVAVLGDGLWQSRFGGRRDVLGRKLQLDGEPYTVVGVMPPGFRLASTDYDVAVPLQLDSARVHRGNQFLTVIARLKPGVSFQRAQSDMTTIGERLARQYPENAGWGVTVESFRDRFVRNPRQGLTVLMAAVSLILLMACANVANLLLARATGRNKELSIRAALGAGRWRLVRQMLTESLVLSSLGGALGLLLGVSGARLQYAVMPAMMLPVDRTLVDGTVLGYTALISLATAILFGIAPALTSSRASLSDSLKEGARGSSGAGRGRVRSMLVVSEVALAMTLLVGAGLLIRSFARLLSVDPGFRPENVITMEISLPERAYPKADRQLAFFEEVLARVGALPGVRSASVVSILPMGGSNTNWSLTIEGRPEPRPGQGTFAGFRTISPEYFRTMQIGMQKGRAFTAQDRDGAAPVVIISQTMASRFWPKEDPIGKRFKLGGPPSKRPWMTIVGISRDIANFGLQGNAWPIMFVPQAQMPSASMALAVRTAAEPAGMAKAVRGAVYSVDRNQPVANVRTLEEVVARTVMVSRVVVSLLGVFSALALLLAGIGLYGVISYSVAQRSHEIGIRIALGAGTREVLGMVVRQGMLLACIGIAIGLAGALAVTRLLSSMLFGVTPRDPLTLGSVAVLLAAVALAATLVPARRATRVDPIHALRHL